MNEEKRTIEGEMGSGDSDDEFYNVKLPCTPSVPTCISTEKLEIKKIYSPSKTKITYNYNFDSSSDDESETTNGWKQSEKKNELTFYSNTKDKKLMASDKETKSKLASSLPQNTYKVVEKINEELKNAKNYIKTVNEKQNNSTGRQNCITSPIQSPENVPKPQLGVISPMVMVPPMLVPQAPVMNINQMMVPSTNLISRHMVGMNGNLLRASAPIGGIMANSNNAIPSAMMTMNTMQNQMSNLIGVQSSIIGLTGNGMGLQANMAMQKNMLRMTTMTGNGIFNMQQPVSSVLAVQGTSPTGNLIGMTGPVNNTRPPDTIIRTQNIRNSGEVGVNPDCVKNNTSGMMVIGNVMNTYGTANSSADAIQTTMVANTISDNFGSNVEDANEKPQKSPTVPTVLPASFSGIKNTPSTVGNFKWQSNIQNPDIVMNITGSSASIESLGPRDSPFASVKSDNSCDINKHHSKNKEKLQSVAFSSFEASKSQSPSLSFNPSKDLSNTFKNDGSFMEMFKKMKGEKNLKASNNMECSESKEKSNASVKTPPVILSGIVGKRRGGRVLKTGLVKKVKKEGDTDEEKRPKDAWSMYMEEVKKYREASCEEEGKTRPLILARDMEKGDVKLSTVPYDPRFPNTNQTKNCYFNFLEYHRCTYKNGEGFEACEQFKKVYSALCPNVWVEKWNDEISEGTFAGRIKN